MHRREKDRACVRQHLEARRAGSAVAAQWQAVLFLRGSSILSAVARTARLTGGKRCARFEASSRAGHARCSESLGANHVPVIGHIIAAISRPTRAEMCLRIACRRLHKSLPVVAVVAQHGAPCAMNRDEPRNKWDQAGMRRDQAHQAAGETRPACSTSPRTYHRTTVHSDRSPCSSHCRLSHRPSRRRTLWCTQNSPSTCTSTLPGVTEVSPPLVVSD